MREPRACRRPAAHCVYTPGGGYDKRLVFAPGLHGDGVGGIVTPYGTFESARMWAPRAYVHGHCAVDFAFVALAPRADGALPGDVAGIAATAANVHLHRGQRVYELGYPAEGVFATPAGHFGLDPYACDTTVMGYAHAGRYKAVVSRCTMNGGASGGKWLTQHDDGPTIVAINAWCAGPYHRPVSRYVLPSCFDRRYVALWRKVVRAGAI